MAYGYLIEQAIAAHNVDAWVDSVINNDMNLDGGSLVWLSKEEEDFALYTANVPDTDHLEGLYIVLNPTEHLTEIEMVRANTAEHFAGLSRDPRVYTNLKGRPADADRLSIGDKIRITKDCLDSTVAPETVVKGDFLHAIDGSVKFGRTAAATGAPADTTTFIVDEVTVQPFPQPGIGRDEYLAFDLRCIHA